MLWFVVVVVVLYVEVIILTVVVVAVVVLVLVGTILHAHPLDAHMLLLLRCTTWGGGLYRRFHSSSKWPKCRHFWRYGAKTSQITHEQMNYIYNSLGRLSAYNSWFLVNKVQCWNLRRWHESGTLQLACRDRSTSVFQLAVVRMLRRPPPQSASTSALLSRGTLSTLAIRCG